jgi:hypothetical protein
LVVARVEPLQGAADQLACVAFVELGRGPGRRPSRRHPPVARDHEAFAGRRREVIAAVIAQVPREAELRATGLPDRQRPAVRDDARAVAVEAAWSRGPCEPRSPSIAVRKSSWKTVRI